MKRMLIEKIENGVVIDHIPADMGKRIVSLLQWLHPGCLPSTMLGTRFKSNKMGEKDIVKVSDINDFDYNYITLMAPEATVKVVKNFEVVDVVSLELPKEVAAFLTCGNPTCITNTERWLASHFSLIKDKQYKCKDCGSIFDLEEMGMMR